MLHVVVRHDGTETRRQDGAIVPVVEIETADLGSRVDGYEDGAWSRFGGEVCAEELTRHQPAVVRSALWDLGDRRLAAKTARVEARLTQVAPGDVLYQELWDGLGFAMNREQMRAVAERLPLSTLEAMLATVTSERRHALALALQFGVAGFLPLSPADANSAGVPPDRLDEIDRLWRERGAAWHELALAATAWVRARVRPANHPARRLAGGAALLAAAKAGLVAELLGPLRRRHDSVAALRALTEVDGEQTLGGDRASGLVGNVVIPFALALAEHTGDRDLTDAASAAWEQLAAAEANQVTRRAQRQVAGDARLSSLGFRGQQGLIHLDQVLCTPRRCYECPIARCVLNAERDDE